MRDSNHLPIAVLLVEPNDIARNGLALLLDADPRFTLVRAAHGIHDAQAQRLQPDLIVVDPSAGRRIQPEILAAFAAAAPNAYICVRTGAIDQGTVLDAIHNHRVNACILKSGHVGDHLLDVLWIAVHTGGGFIDAVLLEKSRSESEGRLVLQPRPSLDCRLTPREIEVLCLLAEGESSKEIAVHLNIAESTVGSHLGRARDGFGARTNEQLVRLAMRHGLLP
ncbi:MAG: LuxR C-terminal-related transcriptional regulator [Dehalococcoidia bacterium]